MGGFFSVFSDFYIILFDFFFPHWLNTRWKERDTTSVSSSWRGKSYFCSSGYSAGLSVPVITAEATEAAGGASLPLEWRAPSGNSGGAFPVPAAPSPGKWAEGGEPGPARPGRAAGKSPGIIGHRGARWINPALEFIHRPTATHALKSGRLWAEAIRLSLENDSWKQQQLKSYTIPKFIKALKYRTSEYPHICLKKTTKGNPGHKVLF